MAFLFLLAPFANAQPVTNEVLFTRVVLNKVAFWNGNSPSTRLYFKSYPIRGSLANWTQWSATITDDTDEVFKTIDSGPFQVGLRGIPSFSGSWDVKLNGTEYIAGECLFLPKPGHGIALAVRPRARTYGVSQLFLLGPGAFKIRNQDISTHPLANCNLLEVLENDTFVVESGDPMVLLSYDPRPSKLPLKARLRERPLSGLGSAYSANPRNPLTYSNSTGTQVVELYSFKNRNGGILTTNTVEVEVVARLPELNFMVDASGLK